MKRKLVKQGVSTLMVSLPSKWIKANGLDKGSEIDLEENGNKVIISSDTNVKDKKNINIKINSENSDNLKNVLTHLYRKGFDKIILEGINTDSLKEIRQITKNLLLGFEVTESSGNKCTIENISEPTQEKYESIVNRLFFTINETADICLTDFEIGKLDNLNEMKEIKDQHDKFVLFCRRSIINEGVNEKALLEWELLTFLTHIQHSYFYLYKYSHENKIKADNKIILILKELKNYFGLYNLAYKNSDLNAIHKINSEKTKFQFGKCFELLEKSKGNQNVVYSYIREIFRLIQVGTSPILLKILDLQN
jgi:phosphate uptake regulator